MKVLSGTKKIYPGGVRHLLVYSVIRIGLWLLVWWILAQTGLGLALAGVMAAFIAMLLSILFLRGPRDKVARQWMEADQRRAAKNGPKRDEDADEEDALLGH